jgi:hypothetical protein
MVIIGVKEGYREAKMVAMRMACEEVPEPVENVWNAYFAMETSGLRGDGCGNLLFHVEHIQGIMVPEGCWQGGCSTWNIYREQSGHQGYPDCQKS